MAEITNLTLLPVESPGPESESQNLATFRADVTLKFEPSELRAGLPCRVHLFLTDRSVQQECYIRASWNLALLWDADRQEQVSHFGHLLLKVAPISKYLEVSRLFQVRMPAPELRLVGAFLSSNPGNQTGYGYGMPVANSI